LEVVQRCDSNEQLIDVSDLLAIMITVAKRIYLQNAPKRNQHSAVVGLNSAIQQNFKVDECAKKLCDLNNKNVLWDGKVIYSVGDNNVLTMSNGVKGSCDFGCPLENLQLSAAPRRMWISDDDFVLLQEKESFGKV
jgi:hypothetical protein